MAMALKLSRTKVASLGFHQVVAVAPSCPDGGNTAGASECEIPVTGVETATAAAAGIGPVGRFGSMAAHIGPSLAAGRRFSDTKAGVEDDRVPLASPLACPGDGCFAPSDAAWTGKGSSAAGAGFARGMVSNAAFLRATMPGGSQPSPISAARPMLAAFIIASVTSSFSFCPTMALKLARPRLASPGLQTLDAPAMVAGTRGTTGRPRGETATA
mmetsp:Transcript_129926/g.277430  ORF Transcript_129926/g.277430 Transcript_129926/m.277430 type:complete len:214 (+) Transcript_129926:190-831(+)